MRRAKNKKESKQPLGSKCSTQPEGFLPRLIEKFHNERQGHWIGLTLEKMKNCSSLKIMTRKYSEAQFESFFRWFAKDVINEASLQGDAIRREYIPIIEALKKLNDLFTDPKERAILQIIFEISPKEIEDAKLQIANLHLKLTKYENALQALDSPAKESVRKQIKNQRHLYIIMTAAKIEEIFGKRWPKFIEDLFNSRGVADLIKGDRLTSSSIRRLLSRTAKNKDIPGIYLKENPGK